MGGNVYGEVNQQRRGMAERRSRVDRRLVSRHRAAFDRSSDRAAEQCHLQCSGCGWLMPPRPVDPLRDGAALMAACKHCGTHAWIDLTDDDAVRGLANVESFEHDTIDPAQRLRHWSVRIGGALAMGAIGFFTITSSYSIIFSTLATVVCLLTIPYFLLGYGNAVRVQQRSLPYRWALPLAPTVKPIKRGARAQGIVAGSVDSESMVAPLSGRECLGFVVVVRDRGAPINAVPALVAQHCVDIVVDSRPFQADAVRLDLETTPANLAPERRAAAVSFLRSHGILETEGDWEYEEAVLQADTRVVVAEAVGHGAILTAG